MNRSRQIPFRMIALALCFISIGAYGQKQTKTFKEIFAVGDGAVLDINTSHADIEFETWNKDQVVIEATIELEGATDREAERYFEDRGIEIIGNSKKIKISTASEKNQKFAYSVGNHHDFRIEIPELQEIESLVMEIPELAELSELAELAELTPMLPLVVQNFDYKKYKKEGDIYLKEWKKEFEKNFDKDYKKKLDKWSKRMDDRREKLEGKREEMRERREEARTKRLKMREELHEKRTEARELQGEARRHLIISGNRNRNGQPNTFYWSSDGEDRNYKVKKTIKIKMPKALKIKMNVRHGEVKLAENTKNINATLSHASLLAATIDGDQTTIMASYSPVSVQKWNYGQLEAKYSEHIDLKEVLNIRLSAKSSDVTIDHLINSAFIQNNFGPLRINSVSKDFSELDISLQNAELNCELPPTSYTIYVNGSNSEFSYPASLRLSKTENHSNVIHSGYHINKNSGKTIRVNSSYSKVVVE